MIKYVVITVAVYDIPYRSHTHHHRRILLHLVAMLGRTYNCA